MNNLNKKALSIAVILLATVALIAYAGWFGPSEKDFQKVAMPYFKSEIASKQVPDAVFISYEQLDSHKVEYVDGTLGYIVIIHLELKSQEYGQYHVAYAVNIRVTDEGYNPTGGYVNWLKSEDYSKKSFKEKVANVETSARVNLTDNGHIMEK